MIGLGFIPFFNNNIEEKRKEKLVRKFAGFLPWVGGFCGEFRKFARAFCRWGTIFVGVGKWYWSHHFVGVTVMLAGG